MPDGLPRHRRAGKTVERNTSRTDQAPSVFHAHDRAIENRDDLLRTTGRILRRAAVRDAGAKMRAISWIRLGGVLGERMIGVRLGVEYSISGSSSLGVERRSRRNPRTEWAVSKIHSPTAGTVAMDSQPGRNLGGGSSTLEGSQPSAIAEIFEAAVTPYGVKNSVLFLGRPGGVRLRSTAA